MRTSTGSVLALCSMLACVLCACAAVGPGVRGAPGSASPAPAAPKIELLGFPGCPNTPTLRANLTAALASIGKGWAFTDTNQEMLPERDIRRGYPTPTILVNGRDLFGLPVPTGPGMGCRTYPGGVPDAGDIAHRLQAVARGR